MTEEGRRKRASRLSDVFPSALTGKYHIEINGSSELVVEGCMGVLLCGDEQIKLNIGRQTLLITGCDLTISSMFGQSVYIRGRLVSLEFI